MIARIPVYGRELDKNTWMVKNVLDVGVHGIVFPHIETLEQVFTAIREMRYPQASGAPDLESDGIRVGGAMTAAQPSSTDPDGWMLPRTPDGQPDLQGVWANNTATPLQRPEAFAGREVLSDEELATLNQRLAELRDSEQAGDLLGDRLIQQALGDPNFTRFDAETGNYNSFWLVEREIDNRTSLIVDPPDGRIPDLTPKARQLAEARRAYRREHPADGPEYRGLGDRCLNFTTPRMGAGYNSYFQILQTPGYVAILQEMGHQARMIPIDGRPHLAEGIHQWNGDARGRWEGDSLVIETTNFSPKSRFRGSTENLRLIERYTRVDPDTIKQEITLNDPLTWTSPWTVVIYLRQSQDQLFEYACHEGNYAMVGILAGARAEEQEHAAAEAANEVSR